jgi:DNA-binding MarR family transcriptional regulator
MGHDTELDAVDSIVEQWQRERPDLDPLAKHVTGRVIRLAGLFQSAYSEAFEPLGLSDSDYGVLAPLRRAGAPYELSPTDLARSKMMTSGGMTAALDRLERKGWISRVANAADRRSNLVRLTEAGLAIIDDAMTRHAAVEARLVAPLDDAERTQLVGLLRRLVIAIDRD